jgi:putative ABC transport system permease protein
MIMARFLADLWRHRGELLLHLTEAAANLRAAKLRSALALIGIVIGAAAVTATINIGEISQREVIEQFSALGPDLVRVEFMPGGDPRKITESQALSITAVNEVVQDAPALTHTAPLIAAAGGELSYAGRAVHSTVTGTSEAFAGLARLRLAQGRFVSRLDGAEPFVVVGSEFGQVDLSFERFTRRLFGADADDMPMQPPPGASRPVALGDVVRVGSSALTVIGVLAPTPSNPLLSVEINRAAFIPVEAVRRLASREGGMSTVVVGRLAAGASVAELRQQLQTALQKRGLSSVPQVRDAGELADTMRKQARLYVLLFGAIAGISLLVGGIGIMNIMLVAVTERRKEIGLRLAVGAYQSDIARLFLAEATTLSVTGGVAGLVIGVLLSYGFSVFSNIQFIFSALAMTTGIIVSTLIGIFFGYYPALRAAQLDPVEALRAE